MLPPLNYAIFGRFIALYCGLPNFLQIPSSVQILTKSCTLDGACFVDRVCPRSPSAQGKSIRIQNASDFDLDHPVPIYCRHCHHGTSRKSPQVFRACKCYELDSNFVGHAFIQSGVLSWNFLGIPTVAPRSARKSMAASLTCNMR